MNLFNSDRTQPLQQLQPVTANSGGQCSLFKTPLKVLQSVFGHEDFRPKQLESIEHIISGEDVIVVMPTGGGKTVIYAIPSLILPGIIKKHFVNMLNFTDHTEEFFVSNKYIVKYLLLQQVINTMYYLLF